MSTEYALLSRQGDVLSIVTSERTLEDLQASYPGYEVRPLGEVTLGALRRYKYWNERP